MPDLILSPILVRPCIKCGASERYADGHCKPCARRTSTEYALANKEKCIERSRAWREKHPDRAIAACVAWRKANADYLASYAEKNKGRKSISTAAWRAANKDRYKANFDLWQLNNKDHVSSRRKVRYAANLALDAAKSTKWRMDNKARAYRNGATWRAANKDHVAHLIAAWHKANPGAARIYRHNRDARKRDNGGKLSNGLAEILFKLQRGKCACCGKPLGEKYHMDHIMPLALGGPNTDDNIQLLRQRCNSQKCAKHPVDFMQSRGFLL